MRCGERETVMVLGAGGVGVGIREVEKLPPLQEVSPGNRSAETKSRAKIERWVRKKKRITIPKHCQRHSVSGTDIEQGSVPQCQYHSLRFDERPQRTATSGVREIEISPQLASM